MKKTFSFFFLFAFLLFGVFITSCKDDDDPNPVVINPEANFTFAADATNPLMVTFTNTSTPTTGATYSWNFGDQSAAVTTASPTHTYAAAGTYQVALTVTADGKTDTETKPVTVTAPEPTGIVVDGEIADWDDIAVTAEDTVETSSLDYIKVTSDENFMYFLAVAKEGRELGHFQIYFDADNDPETGWVSWFTGEDKAGFDALLEYGHSDTEPSVSLFTPEEDMWDNTNDWPWLTTLASGATVGTLRAEENRGHYELSVSKLLLDGVGNGLTDQMRILVRDIALDWSVENGILPAAGSNQLLVIDTE